MKVAYFLFLIAMCEGRPSDDIIIGTSPDNIGITSYGDENKTGLVIHWSKVTSTDPADPVLGYKVKIWTVKKVKTTVYANNAEGELVPTEKEDFPPINNSKDVSDEFTEIDVPADKTDATYTGVKMGVTYEVGVLAYTAKNKGAFSRKSRIELHPSN